MNSMNTVASIGITTQNMKKYSHQLSNAGKIIHFIFLKKSFIFETQQIISTGNGNGKKQRTLAANSISIAEHKLLETF